MMILTIGGWLIFITFLLSLFKSKYNKFLRVFGWFMTSIMLFVYANYTWFEEQSIAQAILSIISGIVAFYVLYLIIINKTSVRQTTIFITISSGLLLLFYTISIVQVTLIQHVAGGTSLFVDLMGYNITLEPSDNGMYIVFLENNLRTEIVMACTGIGSIALFAGFISSIDTISIQMKLILMSISSSVIYLLNIIRNVFIAGAYGGQWFHIYPEYIGLIFGRSDEWVSFYIADRIISQVGAILVMIFFTLLIIRLLEDETRLIKEWEKIISSGQRELKNLNQKI